MARIVLNLRVVITQLHIFTPMFEPHPTYRPTKKKAYTTSKIWLYRRDLYRTHQNTGQPPKLYRGYLYESKDLYTEILFIPNFFLLRPYNIFDPVYPDCTVYYN